MTTKTELLNNGVVVATRTAAPFYSWDWTPATSGASSLTYKRYEDNVLVFTSGAITGTVDAAAGDTTAPTILSATVEDANKDKLVVVFSEVVNITDVTGLTITGDVTPTLSAPTGTGTNTITFTLSTALTNGQSVTLNIAGTNTIADAAANALAVTTQAVINNVAVVGIEAETTSYMNAVAIPNDSTIYYSSTPQEITGAAIWTAIDNYVKELKSAAIYAKFKAIYPLIGDTAIKMKWNLKNPLDTDAAFRLAFFGSGILSATGWKGNGSNTYLETFLNSSTQITLNSESVGYYIRTSSSSGMDGGVFISGFGTTVIVRTGFTAFRSQSQTESAVSLTNITGLIAVNRIVSSFYKVQSRDSLFTVNTVSTANALVNTSFQIGKIGGTAGYSDREYSFSYISEGLTDTELLAHNTAVENLQTALKRNVV